MTIRKKLYAGFLAVLLILSVLAGVSYYQISNVDKSYSQLIDDRAQKVLMTKELQNIANKEQINLSSYLVTGDQGGLDQYNQAVKEYETYSKDMAKLVKTAKGKQLLDQLNSYEKDYRYFADSIVELKKENKTDEYSRLMATQGSGIVNNLIHKADEMAKYQKSQLDEGKASTSDKVDSLKLLVLILSVASVLVGLVIAYVISRVISKPLLLITRAARKIAAGDLTNEEIRIKNRDEIQDLAKSFNTMTNNLRDLIQSVSLTTETVAATSEELSASAEQTSKASEQITYTIQEVASGVEKQFQSIEETSTTINEMASGVQLIADSSRVVTTTAQETSKVAAEGGNTIDTAVQQMNSIHHSIQGLAEVIDHLRSRSHEISQIINVITGISDQTNLLALNAAIEAARAGEHGRGFSVVADEVRKLAEQSSVSAQQIGELIKGIQQETQKAVQSMEKATNEVLVGIETIHTTGESFHNIEGSVNQVANQIQEVSAAVQEMAAGTEQMVQSMNDISRIGEVAASNSRQVTGAAEEQLLAMEEITSSTVSMAKMAEELKNLIGKFKIQKTEE